MKFLLTRVLLASSAMLASSFVTPAVPSMARQNTVTAMSLGMSTTDEVDVAGVLDSLKQLLEHLDGPDGGRKLYQASSPSWQAAIQAAVGAPGTANANLVADALQQAMARPHNQFAILMGNHDDNQDFEAIFPTDPVVNDDSAIWVECQLRETGTNELLVDMGLNLIQTENGEWKIDDLQWQDFRDAFYPGLSGREWLRAF